MSRSSHLVSLEAKAVPFLQLRPGSSAAPEGALPMQVIRRNGTVSKFDASKISVAMTKAFLAVEGHTAAASRRVHEVVEQLTAEVVGALSRRISEGRTFHIEDVQDQVELALDAQRTPQGGACLCALSRGTGPAARRAGSRQIGQAIVWTDAASDAGERHESSTRYRAARVDRQRSLRRPGGRRGGAGARRNPAQSL